MGKFKTHRRFHHNFIVNVEDPRIIHSTRLNRFGDIKGDVKFFRFIFQFVTNFNAFYCNHFSFEILERIFNVIINFLDQRDTNVMDFHVCWIPQVHTDIKDLPYIKSSHRNSHQKAYWFRFTKKTTKTFLDFILIGFF